jgi:hypothetical protein
MEKYLDRSDKDANHIWSKWPSELTWLQIIKRKSCGKIYMVIKSASKMHLVHILIANYKRLLFYISKVQSYDYDDNQQQQLENTVFGKY